MIKIKICEVAPRGACSYYRSLGPFLKIHKLNPEIHVEHLEAVSWTAIADADILFLARPYADNYLEAMELAKSFGVKIWIDFDDDLTILPEDNPGHDFFSQENVIKNVKDAIKFADIVTVSTKKIKKTYESLNSNIYVIENAFNDYNYNFIKRSNNTKNISWRGSNTHIEDLWSCKDSIISVSEQFSEWTWNWIGGGSKFELWFLFRYIKNYKSIIDTEIVKYNRLIFNLMPEIHICPLLDTEFTRCKSNIAWIESTWAGAVCLAPNLPEFQKPGCVNYTDNFEYLLTKLIKSRSFRQENYAKSFNYIKENLLLSQINKKRINVINEVLK